MKANKNSLNVIALNAAPLNIKVDLPSGDGIVHDGHYICLGGAHYKTSDGMYYKCSSN